MIKVNIVYSQMREPRFEVPWPQRDAHVVWTVREEAGADVVVHCNGYSYNRKDARSNPDAFRILYIYEPLVVFPRNFMRSFWKPFDAVMTWNEALLEQDGKFVRFPSLYYDFPFGAVHGIAGNAERPEDWHSKRKAICQVAGNKRSFIASELYSRRRAIARWFGRNGTLSLDTYGLPPMPVPGYRGAAKDKLETLSQYRFALCLENDGHPIWSRGYVTEKIFDCFYAYSVPVYLGAADIERHVPADCFINLRQFDSLDALDRYLSEMPDEEYEKYLKAIEQFLKTYNAPDKHSCFRFYDSVIELAAKGISKPEDPSVQVGFWQRATFSEKCRCLLMVLALPVYRALRGTRYAGT